MDTEKDDSSEAIETPGEKLVWTPPILVLVAEARSAATGGSVFYDGSYGS